MNSLSLIPGCRIRHVTPLGQNALVVAVEGRASHGRCPACRHISGSVHSSSVRQPADLPSFGREVRLSVRVRRFYCHNHMCSKQTFTEPLPHLLKPHARRTRRLTKAQARIGIALGGEPGARLLVHLAMPASADTLLRLVRHQPLPARQPPRIVGVDDWAMKKGRTYGSILVDLERRKPIELLPDRTASTFSGWLQRHPDIKIIARDRSSEYAKGAATASKAIQVADRWHLLLNARQMVERWLAGAHARLRRLPLVEGSPVASGRRARAYPRTRAEQAASAASRDRWQALYEEVRQRHARGEALLAISRTMGLARGTVRKFAQADSFPARAVRQPGPSILDPFLPHLHARLAAGHENATALWRELRDLGFAGSPKQVYRWLAERRTAPAKTTADKWRSTSPTRPAAGALLPSPKQLAWLLVRPPATLDATEAAVLARVRQDREAALLTDLAQRFCTLVRQCCRDRQTRNSAQASIEALTAWIAEARLSGIGAVETFAAGLEQDSAAVRAALTQPWSSGQAEGQITRLKLFKRSMYGRANFDLLRRRVLLAA
ncbi:ISL3 family transposase [Microvirga tunisiensis]|uniref:ISL3 family transposase n=2 Tax=Microvirga tunisiensis TaxID=2108360 RepID=A0A5N7MZZ0_9HYPH|nr:ISL3 family transposase [Microvirga tunisiensis]MPR13564.1 ISL3 family transposase [Microvirga tunisiensis]MPR31414.1 ISL3 family transposase [Microvirga tunisiensis]